jgi:UDP:flavonoid glycosyltransferase YjiC (YdhE family)
LKRILISPLDWGLGHATRCVPLIRHLLASGAEVVLAGNGRSAALLLAEFPQLEFVGIPGYDIHYPSDGSMALRILFSVPRILQGIRREHAVLQDIIHRFRIHAVIADNRYGLWSKKVPSVFIGHQLFVQSPVGGKFLSRVQLGYIRNFSRCWVPDLAGEGNLSGRLSHTQPLPPGCKFIGPLSRFAEMPTISGKKYDTVVVLSGPEPQRSILEAKIRLQAAACSGNILLIRGLPEAKEEYKDGKLTIVSHLSAAEMFVVMREADVIVGRSGYSSIMDASFLGKKCILIPTPGQTEQEYLAAYHASLGHCLVQKQADLNLSHALEEVRAISGFRQTNFTASVWKKELDEFLEKC